MDKRIGHAIIGCGRIAQNHYNAAIINGFDVLCCCDKELDKAKTFAKNNNIKIYTDDYREILNNEEIDSVSICTDHISHTIIAEKLCYNKNLIIEKPLSANYNIAKDFCDKFKDNPKEISVISQHRFDDAMILVKKIIDNNDLGKVTLVNAKLKCERKEDYYLDSYWRGKKEKEGGSTVINQAYHIIDALTFLFGIPKEVKSFCENLKFKDIIETEDTCVSIFKYDNFIGTFSSTNTSNVDWETSIEIVGTKGSIIFNLDFPERIIEFNLNDSKYNDELQKIVGNYNLNKGKNINYYGLSHNRQFLNFKEAILKHTSLKVDLKEAIKTQEFLDMIYNGE